MSSTFSADVPDWVALRTAANWEKKLADGLSASEVPSFLPLITRRTIYSGKTRNALVPLFGGYVFCSHSAFLDNPVIPKPIRSRVAQILKPSDFQQLRDELSAVAEMLGCYDMVQERTVGKVGDVVQVKAGLLMGQEATIAKLQPKKRKVVLTISLLGIATEVEVDDHLIVKM